ncbi:hypothetical protein ROZALSC1DRAFT_25126 [Rozella allomycis CSF55]|uniref:Uncharacterized protein n=1 Tax=Rozella allomycis (strain CSF55) TaxID=988480 RepID=A0A4P9YD68_ROZAC|nr:hypothetical protein ROZALSC1DRAFT_25126 [Rozella allomycis CSF55]
MDIVFTFSLPKSETVEDIKNIPSGVFIIKWGKMDVSLMYQSSLIFRFQLEQNSLPIRLGNSPHSELFSTPDIKLTVSTYSELGVSRDFLDFFQRIFGYWENKEKQLPSFHFEGFIYNYNDCAIQHNNIKTFIKSNGIDGDDIRNLISSRQQIKVDEDFNFFSFLDWVPNFKAIIKDKNFPCFIPYFCDFSKVQSFSEPFQVFIVIDLESELTSFCQNISSEIFSILDIFSFNMNITQLRFEFSSDPIFFDIFVNGFSMIMIDAKQFMFSMTSNRKPTDNFKKSAQIVEPINITIKTTNQYADAYNVLKSLEMFQVFAPTSIASPSVKNLNIKTIPFDNFTLSYGQSDVSRTNLLSNILSNVINEMQVENYAFNLQDYINVKVIKTKKSFLTLQFILDKYLDSNLNKFLPDGFKINLYEKENILFNVYYHNSDLFLMLYNDKMQVTRVINAIVGGQGSNLDLLFVTGEEEILKISFRIPVFIQNYQEDLIIRDSKHVEPSFFNVAFDFSDFFSLFKLSVPLKMDIYNPTLLEVSLASLHLRVSLYDPKSVTSRKIAVYRKLTKQCNVNPYPECLYTNSSSSSLLQLKPMTVNSLTVPLKLIKLGETFSSIIKNGLNHCINIAVQLFLVVANENQEPFLFPINITMNKISTTEKAIRKDVCRTIMNCIPRSRLADTISPLPKQNSFRIYDNSQSPTENDIYWYPATIHSSESFILSLSFSHRSSQTNLKVFQLQAQANLKELSHDSFAFHRQDVIEESISTKKRRS